MGDAEREVEHRLRARRRRTWLIASLGGVTAALALVFGPQLGPASAADDISLTLTTSADGTSSAGDAIEVETLTFGEVTTAIDALPSTGASVTLPVKIAGFGSVAVDDVTVLAESSSASVAFTGTASEVLGIDLGSALELDVLVVADWDENDAADDEPRLIVSAQLTQSTLGELIGLDAGELVADIPLPNGAVTVTNRPDATIPVDGESILDPSTLPPNARAYFEQIDADGLRSSLPLRGGVNVQAAIDVGNIDPAVNRALGFTAGDRLKIDGSIGLNVREFATSSGSPISGLTLRAVAPTITLPTEVTNALGLEPVELDATFEIAASDAETPDDSSDDTLRVFLGAAVDLSAPLPEIDLDLGIEITTTGSDDVAVLLSANVGSWVAPFGVAELTLSDVALAATIESTSVGGAPDVAVNFDAEAVVADKSVTVSIAGELSDTASLTIDVGLNDAIALGELLGALGVDTGASGIPAHVLASNFGPADLRVEVAGDGAGGFELDASMSGDFELFLLPTSTQPIAATLLAEFSIGSTADVTLGIRPNGRLALGDVVANGDDDFELNSADSAFGIVFSTAGIDTTLGDMDAPAAAFFSPLFDDDDTAEISIPAGVSVFGTVVLPDHLAEFVGNTLGLDPTVSLSGTIPFGGGELFSLSLGLELDPSKTPDWVEAGALTMKLSATTTKVNVELEGSLTVRLRSGVSPEIAADLAALGVDLHADEPVDEGFDCPGAGSTHLVDGDTGPEYRCFDSLTFEVDVALSVSPTEVSATLGLELDTTVMGDDFGWNPFGLSWVTINNVRLELGLQWEAAAPAPGVSVTMGFRGDVVIADKDLAAAFKVSVQPLPYPPFALVEPEGFALTSNEGFELDDFFELHHEIATVAATINGTDPAAVPAAIAPEDLGIPNVGLRNLDLSFSTKGVKSLCIPKGLHISADLYVDAADDVPASQSATCDDDGSRLPVDPAARCTNNADKGCVAGIRVAITTTGFTGQGSLNGFEVGPITFDGAEVDLAVTPSDQHLRIYGAATFDPIGTGQLQMSLEVGETGIDAAFAGRVGIGPESNPYITALVEGRTAFDLDAMDESGIDLRFVLNASNLDIDQLSAAIDDAAAVAVELSAAAIIEFLDDLDIEIAAFQADPVGYVATELTALGIDVPPVLQPFVDGIAALVAEGVTISENFILRGQLPGLPTNGVDQEIGCSFLEGEFFQVDGKCYTTPPAPAGGVDPVEQCALTITSAVLSTDGRCYTIPPEGIPAGGIDMTGDNCLVFWAQHTDGRCYTTRPNTDNPDGIPAGGRPVGTCTLTTQWSSYDDRCYLPFSSASDTGTPSGGIEPPLGCVGSSGVTTVGLSEGRCYTIIPIPSVSNADPVELSCPTLTPLEASDGRCYTLLPIDTGGLCDILDLIDGVDLSSTCTRADILAEVIEPAIYAAADLTVEAVEATTEVLGDIDGFGIECAEFSLVLDRSTVDVDIDVTAGLGGEFRTFSIAWDLDDPIVDNLTSLLEGILGSTPEECTDIDFDDFSATVFDDDGGELLHPSEATADTVRLDEGRSQVLRPFANDANATTSEITSVQVLGTAPTAGVSGLVAAAPVDGVSVEIGADGRSIVFTSVDDLAPGQTRDVAFSFSSTNASGLSTVSTGTVTLVGKNNAPVVVSDDATLDLRTATSIDVDVLDNDTDREDGTVDTIIAVDPSTALGCATSTGAIVQFSAASCTAGASVYAFLADGQTLSETFAYTATDSDSVTGTANVDLTVIGANDAPNIEGLRVSRRVVGKNVLVIVTGRIVDPDQSDTHQIVIEWGDGTSSTIAVGTTRGFRTSHSFDRSGSVDVRAEVTDASGATGGATSRLFVLSTASLNAQTVDVDGDGFSAATDCRDLDASINPGATEVPGNGIDENCNGNADDVVAADPGDGGTTGGDDGGTDGGTDGDTTGGTDGGTTGGNGGDSTGGTDGSTTGGDADPAPQTPSDQLPSTGSTVLWVLALGLAALLLGLLAQQSAVRRRTAAG